MLCEYPGRGSLDRLSSMSPPNRAAKQHDRPCPRPGRGAWLGALLALSAAWVSPADSEAQSFTITASAGAGGSIVPSGSVTVASGGDQAFTIAPDACYTIADVQVDGGSVGPAATYTFTNVTADHAITASFALQTPTVAVTSDSNPSAWGQLVTFTATVPASATGNITFKDSLTTLGTVAPTSGTAQLQKSNLSPGNHTHITAVYSGDACYAPATSPAYAQLVTRVATVVNLTSDVHPSTFGENVVLTATVSPAGPTGRVAFLDGANSLGTATVNVFTGVATLNVGNLLPGTHALTAHYPGDAHFDSSTSVPYAQIVDPQTTSVELSTSVSPSVCKQLVTWTATVTPGEATGTVSFIDGSTTLGTVSLGAGVATFGSSTLAVG